MGDSLFNDPSFSQNLMNFGAGTLAAAGDRTAGGFLRYPGMTALGAGVQNMQQMGLQRANLGSEIALRQAEAENMRLQGQFLQGKMGLMQGLPSATRDILSALGIGGGQQGTPTAPLAASGAPPPTQAYTGAPIGGIGAKHDSLLIPPEKQNSLVDAVTAGTTVPPWLVHGVGRNESGFDAYATGQMTSKGEQAQGWMQVMPSTAAQLGVRDPGQLRDPYVGGKTGVAVLDASARKHGITGPDDPRWMDPNTLRAVLTDYYGHGTPMRGQPNQDQYYNKVVSGGLAWKQEQLAQQAQQPGAPSQAQQNQQYVQNLPGGGHAVDLSGPGAPTSWTSADNVAMDAGGNSNTPPLVGGGPIDVGNARQVGSPGAPDAQAQLPQLQQQAVQQATSPQVQQRAAQQPIIPVAPPPPQIAHQMTPGIGRTRMQVWQEGQALALINAQYKALGMDLGLDGIANTMVGASLKDVDARQGGLNITPFSGEGAAGSGVFRNPEPIRTVNSQGQEVPGTWTPDLAGGSATITPMTMQPGSPSSVQPGQTPITKLSPREIAGQEQAQESNRQMLDADQKELTASQNEAEATQRNQAINAHVYDLADKVMTGGGTTAITNFKNYMNRLAPDFLKQVTERITGDGLDPSNAMLLAKYSLLLSAQQAETYTHARTGITAVTMFQGSNPGLEMTRDVNQKVSVAQMIGTQAGLDWNLGAHAHFNKNSATWRSSPSGSPYSQLSNFSDRYNQVYTPDMYYRAMEAATGKPYDAWAAGLDPNAQKIVLGIIKRARPEAPVQVGNGRTFRAMAFDGLPGPADLIK